ncbi:hypothetical protein TcG_01524 [Trypanosoma cruzi]|nr:hypothetical protein TcG_01524 [Trypanosoma cruzi]
MTVLSLYPRNLLQIASYSIAKLLRIGASVWRLSVKGIYRQLPGLTAIGNSRLGKFVFQKLISFPALKLHFAPVIVYGAIIMPIALVPLCYLRFLYKTRTMWVRPA